MPRTSRHFSREARELAPISLLVSFETAEQITAMRIPTPPNAELRLVKVVYEVVKALANTDVGLIDVKDSAGNVVITQISIPLSSAIGTRGEATLSTTDSRLRIGPGQAGAYHSVTTSKVTAGGKVQLFLYYRRIEPNSAQI